MEKTIPEDTVISVDMISQMGFFKKNDVNEKLLLTYNYIPKPVVLGILGAILGLPGYGKKENTSLVEPEFYQKLKPLKIAIEPLSPKGTFTKIMIQYNNSLGYASREEGNILNINEQTLLKPKFRIYLLIGEFFKKNPELALKLKHYLKQQWAEFLPYMGKNEFPIFWNQYQEYKKIKPSSQLKNIRISSIFKKEKLIRETQSRKKSSIFPFQVDTNQKDIFMIFESIPEDFQIIPDGKKIFYHYKIEKFVYTNAMFRNIPFSDISVLQMQTKTNDKSKQLYVQFI